MRTLSTVLSSCLAVTAAGAVWFSQCRVQPDADAEPEIRLMIAPSEHPIVQAVSVPDPVVAPVDDPVFVQVDDPVSAEVKLPVKEPVQPLEERGDAMLFEIEALAITPFDEAIVFPFE